MFGVILIKSNFGKKKKKKKNLKLDNNHTKISQK
jgi:hypothetical protein